MKATITYIKLRPFMYSVTASVNGVSYQLSDLSRDELTNGCITNGCDDFTPYEAIAKASGVNWNELDDEGQGEFMSEVGEAVALACKRAFTPLPVTDICGVEVAAVEIELENYETEGAPYIRYKIGETEFLEWVNFLDDDAKKLELEKVDTQLTQVKNEVLAAAIEEGLNVEFKDDFIEGLSSFLENYIMRY